MIATNVYSPQKLQASEPINKKAFLFPGQGSQTVGMGLYLYENFNIAKLVFEEASDAISFDMKKLCFTGPSEDLALTENTQPALLTVSIATARVLSNDLGIEATITAGHSVGEYASLVYADVLSFRNAIRAVRVRGQAMQSAVPVGQGGMTAVLGLDEKQIQYLCDWAVKKSGHAPLSPANYNCNGQIVISGNIKTLEWLKENLKSAGAEDPVLKDDVKRIKLISLQVSAPFHCAMMKPAQDQLQNFLRDIPFANSNIQIIQNINAVVTTQAEHLKRNLIEQVSAPVKWTQSMQVLKLQNISNCFEVGHGNVLKGLLKKIEADFFKVYTTSSLEDLKSIETMV